MMLEGSNCLCVRQLGTYHLPCPHESTWAWPPPPRAS